MEEGILIVATNIYELTESKLMIIDQTWWVICIFYS